MAKRLNKNLVMVLTILGMVLITVGIAVLLKLMPEQDPQHYVDQAEACANPTNPEVEPDYAKAATYYARAYRAASKKDGDYPDYRILAGDMSLKGGDAMQARKFWSAVLLDDPMNEKAQQKSLELTFELAELSGGVEIWSNVEEEAKRLLVINEESYVAMHALGRALVAQRGVNEANVAEGEELLRKAVAGDTSNPAYANSLADYYYRTSRFEEGQEVMDTLIANLSDDPKEQVDAYRFYGQYLLSMKQKYLAELFQKRAQAVSEDLLTSDINTINDYDQRALDALMEARRLSETLKEPDVEALISLGTYYHTRRSLSTDMKEVEAQWTKDLEQAAELYKEAAKKDPHHFIAYLALARLHRQQGEFDEAIQVLQERLDRPFKRDHYLGWRNRVYMSAVRDLAFSYLIDKATSLGRLYDTEDKRQEELAQIKTRLEVLYKEAVAEAPSGEQDPRVLFMKGRMLLLSMEFGKAIDVLKDADKLTPSVNANIKRNLAFAYMQQQLPDLAKVELQEIVNVDPTDPIAWAMLAEVQVMLNQPEEAIRAAGLALRQMPNNRQALQAKRDAFLLQNNYAEAEVVSQQLADALGASDVDRKLERVVMLRMQAMEGETPDTAKLEEAEKLCMEILAADPLNTSAIHQYVVMSSGDPAKYEQTLKVLDHAIAEAETIIQQKGSEVVKTEDGQEIDYGEIIETAKRYKLAVDPDLPDEKKLEQIVSLVKQGDDPFKVALQLFSMYRVMPGHADDAFEQLKIAYELKKDDKRVVDQLFTFALQQKEWKFAEELVDRAIDLELDPSGGYFFRGRLYLAKEEMPDHAEEAIEQFRIGLKAAPNFPNGHVFLGQALMVLKNYDEAESAFMQARSMNSNNAMAAYRLLQLAAIRQNEVQILRWLEECERLIPKNELVVQIRQDMEDKEDPRAGIARREESRKSNPEDVDNLVALAALYNSTGQVDVAKGIYEEALKYQPDGMRIVTEYAQFLATKSPPEFEAAKQLLVDFIDRQGADRANDRAASQLTLAIILRRQASMEENSAVTQEQVDAAFIRAAELASTSAVYIDIATHFTQTGRLDRSEEWFKKAIAKAREEERTTIELTARETLIRAMIGQDDPGREEEIAAEINAFRSRFPNNPVAILLDAELMILTGQDSKALEHLTKYVTNVPEPVQGYYRRGQIYIRSSKWAEAISDLEELKRLNASYANYAPRLLLAMAYEESGQEDKAITELQNVVDNAPGYQQAVRALFSLLLSEKRYDRAQDFADARAKKDPENPLWHAYLAQVASAQDDASTAVMEAEKTVELTEKMPEDVQARMLPGSCDDLISIYMKFQNYDALIAFVENRMPEDLKRAAVVMTLASAYAGKGQMDPAIENYLKSFDAESFSPDALASRLMSDSESRINIPALIQALEKRVAAHPDERHSKLLLAMTRGVAARRYTLAGNAAQAKPLAAEAEKGYEELLASTKADDALGKIIKNFLLKTLAGIRLQEEDYDRARDLYLEALKIAPNDVQTLNNLAFVLIDHYEDAEKALPYAEKALSIVPENPNVMDTVGWCLILTGNYDEGISKVRRSIEGIPQMAEVHYHAAVGFYRRSQVPGNPNSQKDLQEAIAECKRAHELLMTQASDPSNILDEIVKLGESLGLPLRNELPARPAA